jgi:hypothetical protein
VEIGEDVFYPLAWMLREACTCTWRDEAFRLNVFISAIFKWNVYIILDLPYS